MWKDCYKKKIRKNRKKNLKMKDNKMAYVKNANFIHFKLQVPYNNV